MLFVTFILGFFIHIPTHRVSYYSIHFNLPQFGWNSSFQQSDSDPVITDDDLEAILDRTRGSVAVLKSDKGGSNSSRSGHSSTESFESITSSEISNENNSSSGNNSSSSNSSSSCSNGSDARTSSKFLKESQEISLADFEESAPMVSLRQFEGERCICKCRGSG